MMMLKPRFKSLELEESVCRLILRDGLKPGEAILSENQLSSLFSVSRVTVRQAIGRLEEKGVLYREKGRGTFVGRLPDASMAGPEDGHVSTKIIGMVCHQIVCAYFSSLAQGVEDFASQEGYNVCFSSTKGDIAAEEALISEMRRKGIEGVIVSPAESFPPSPFIKRLCAESDNVVIVNDDIPGLCADIVTSDDREGSFLATQRLIDAGHRRIAHIRGSTRIANADDRLSGYLRALEANGILCEQELVKGGSPFSTEEFAFDSLKALLMLPAGRRPSAAFVYNDLMALGAFRAAVDSGLDVPGDFSIIGYGNDFGVLEAGVRISTVDQRACEIGRVAAEILLSRIKGAFPKSAGKRKSLIKPFLIERGSVAAPNAGKEAAQ